MDEQGINAINAVASFLRAKAEEANSAHKKYIQEYNEWCRTGKGGKPIPPVSLPIAAQYMINAAQALENEIQAHGRKDEG